ncbi:helix-turn-helix transcriptional regulator [Clostridium sporogenes]|uniref:helix-turn-helix transcriptional regulator n=1 Tax=Clostridium sporogenes TaxID=1509 RepID=UPI0013D78E98|nr:helix-turn-helix domain-containing protein [Clostridium sporogenes]NFF68916.1 helix-turn-helix transcriptional regulator [Clostridium sporogenes]NFG00377.1 helix-turn-helix transcriptional regulator [Clostridium sporogenes]NFG08024.1 helix-turn-helix transcriptional regulator [Clostridium sporogenes]NFG53221.1 helix-turn-helix transcriptional regulator [Clostridium sporogenes]NFP86038.1 helix-turn-helix transcriptional regulator [Clostridium sporogenes]
MELKDILKNDRKEKEMTQEQYAELVGITRGTLSHLERGREPSIDTSKKLSKYFKKPISELIGKKKIQKLSTLETTNMVIDSLIKKGQIKEVPISDEVKQLIWTSLELEIKLKLQMLDKE